MVGGRVVQQTLGTPMGTNCALLADLFLYYFRLGWGYIKIKGKPKQYHTIRTN
jgi:hypothetical protein